MMFCGQRFNVYLGASGSVPHFFPGCGRKKVRTDPARLPHYVYLLLALTAATGCGCSTGGHHGKQLSSLRIHLETNTDEPKSSKPAPIGRSSPVTVNVEPEPFLTE